MQVAYLQGGENATCIFEFFAFFVLAKNCIFCIFLHLGATSVKEKESHRVGSFLFFLGIFMPEAFY